MLKIPPTPYQKRRRYKSREGAAAPAPLVLVSASYSTSPRRVSMTFDRAIDSTGVNVGAIIVKDGPGHKAYVATLVATPVNPHTLTLNLTIDHVIVPGAHVLLNVASDNGIVAADDGGAFGGVSDLLLPFP